MSEITKIINITPKASGAGLREQLEREAINRGKPMRSFVGEIYTYAVSNRGKFKGALREARAKGGMHIGATVSDEVAKELDEWANEEKTSKGLWCCYILEKALESKLQDKVFGTTDID